MSGGRIGPLCESLLPEDFARVRGLGSRIQNFLEENLPSPLNRAVTLLKVDDEEIVIAASTPVVANYLRLHQKELQQQLRESLSLQQRLRFRSVPDSLLQVARPRQQARAPRQVSTQSIEALERSAEWVEDEDLQAALRSLARSLKQD